MTNSPRSNSFSAISQMAVKPLSLSNNSGLLLKRSSLLAKALISLTLFSTAAPLWAQDSDLDLPVVKPEASDIPVGLPPEPDKDDPRDKNIDPTIFGETINLEGATIVLCVDSSSSMWDEANGKRIIAEQGELTAFILSLSPTINFNIVLFGSGTTRTLWPELKNDKAAALAFVASMRPMGDTPTFQGMAVALGFKENKNVVLLTDGAPTGTLSYLWGPWQLDPRAYGSGHVQLPGGPIVDMNPRLGPNNLGLIGPVVEHERLIWWFNHCMRDPATIDVIGIDVEGGNWEKQNCKWFCQTVANNNGPGDFKSVEIK